MNLAQVRSSPREAGRRARQGWGIGAGKDSAGETLAGDALLLELLPPVFVVVAPERYRDTRNRKEVDTPGSALIWKRRALTSAVDVSRLRSASL